MPNHFHLLIQQCEAGAMSRFIQRLTIGHVLYHNQKYRRVGPLFQGKYKAVRVIGPKHLMEVSRYIHLNPERAGLGWRQHQHSSLGTYLGSPNQNDFVDPAAVLALFDVPGDYDRYLSIAELRSPASH
jgi:putative transposase